jgi:hypothetical protein
LLILGLAACGRTTATLPPAAAVTSQPQPTATEDITATNTAKLVLMQTVLLPMSIPNPMNRISSTKQLDVLEAYDYTVLMRFEWDEEKNQANIRKHQLDFVDARKVFARPLLVALDERKDYGEDRWVGIGMLDYSRIVVVVFTEPAEDIIRIVSFRKALAYERERYEQAFRDEFGAF